MAEKNNILVYDSICVLCNISIRILNFLDRKNRLKFTYFGSEYLKSNLSELQSESESGSEVKSVVFISNGSIYYRSEAVIRSLIICGGIGRLAWIFRFFPLRFRDWIYNGIARVRYSVFGKKDVCDTQPPVDRNKILY